MMKIFFRNIYIGFQVLFNPSLLKNKFDELNDLDSTNASDSILLSYFKKIETICEKYPDDFLLQKRWIVTKQLYLLKDLKSLILEYKELNSIEPKICEKTNKMYLLSKPIEEK